MDGTIYGMVKTTVYLESDLALSLRRMAESEGRSQAELIREALETYTRGRKRTLPRGLGKYSSGEKDVSERTKEILREASKRGKWR
jgi:predicted transcriptional regulator